MLSRQAPHVTKGRRQSFLQDFEPAGAARERRPQAHRETVGAAKAADS